MIKKKSINYPPYAYLLQVAEHCPKAVATYMILWSIMDNENRISVFKRDVRTEFLISLAKFKHDLFLLVKEGLISVDESLEMITIELVGWDIEVDEMTIC